MKNIVIRFYIVALFMLSSITMLAQTPGDTDGTADGLEGADAPAAPIDDYLLPMALGSYFCGI
ncbi:hypothetical protein [Flavobacterium sp. SOK18b]|uniref:hypothetical protein n=1 Tax=Flavobacterium sp. SOK18b TaxID=797900 RepID=UPI0015F891B9|nr:hypothetical protein [Flavobacterium sp. SOK18b]